MKKNDIAIVGMSCYFPGADNIGEFWNNLVNGIDSITDIPEGKIDARYFSYDGTSDIDRFYFHKGGFVNPIGIDPLRYGILPIAAEGIDPEHLIALRLVEDALTDAQVYEKKIPLNNCSFVLGKGNYTGLAMLRIGEIMYSGALFENILDYMYPGLTVEEVKKIKRDYQSRRGRFQADTAAGAMPNLVVSLAANKFNMKGPAYTIDGACASSMLAIEHSIQLLNSGQCDIALAGGMHLGQNASFWGVFNIIGAASRKQQIAPFSEDADGLLIGEGAGIVVLKKLEKAIADNDRIYAVIKGSSSCSDGSDVSVMAPSFKGQVAALKLAWERAGMNPEKVGYVETHGTATQVGDRTEIATLIEFFGDKTAPPALLGSVKSNIGHAMPAAGIAGLIKTALALYHKKIPPTLHCEKPMKTMFESRFQPAQTLTDWDENKYPLIAGVNAFGFGGINTHVIMEAYRGDANAVSDKRKNLLKDKVISLSAATKEELLQKLENLDYTVSKGDYRLVIFNPDTEKINKAKLLIAKNRPWKGRLDIWFSNRPLFKEGGKTAFLFAGFDPGTEIEVQSVADYFDIPYKQVEIGKDGLLGHSINHFYRSKLFDLALKKMGLIPDLNVGHSVGEWHALGAGGYVTPDSIEEAIKAYDPGRYTFSDVFYIAVGCGYDKIKSWCETIPELYLANDNCPNQILMAGREKARDMLIERLKKEQIYYHILPYQSGYHTPLVDTKTALEVVDVVTSRLVAQEHQVPVWSATILDLYPISEEEQYDLGMKHLTQTVRFRELIEKIYEQEQVKMFVQIGFGSLISFVEDTLKDKPISTVSTVVSSLSGIEQLRRIAALFFIEGKTVNKELIGIKEEHVTGMKGKKLVLDMHFENIRDFPLLKEAVSKYMQKIDTIMLPALSGEELDDPVLREINNNLREITALQENLLKWHKAKTSLNTRQLPEKGKNEKATIASPMEIRGQRTGRKIEKTLKITLDEHPYLVDHIVVRQPEHWTNIRDLNPVVPFAMTLELLCENARELMPEKKVLKITSAGVLKWIPVTDPFVSTMSGIWKSEDCISWTIPGHASGDVTLGDAFPPVPEEYAGEIDLGNENLVPVLPNKENLYNYFLFHGPQYQSVIELLKVTKKGLRAHICKTEGKGSMLDNLGQLLGTYCHFALDKDQTTFPMSVEEIRFYQDIQDQKGIFEYTLVVREMKEGEAISNVVIKRNGKVWCVVKGWHNRRFDYSKKLMNVVIRPKEFILAECLDRGVYYYGNIAGRASSIDFLRERYLNSEERKHFASLYLNKAREYLIRCITIKDGVRKYLQEDDRDPLLYPIEISVEYDEKGKPCLCGPDELKGIEISIAHKGSESVVIVSDRPVGIDIEKIEARDRGFKEITFTGQELALMKTRGADEDEWITRFWVAKEAYGKKLGLGLQGNPKQYEVSAIAGEHLRINDTIIETLKHGDDFIIGWTK
jgi:3-oxoacyl-(acyl-carrier-protein) synthase/phosphopantetheinyl transferase (holo-ACP synthase)